MIALAKKRASELEDFRPKKQIKFDDSDDDSAEQDEDAAKRKEALKILSEFNEEALRLTQEGGGQGEKAKELIEKLDNSQNEWVKKLLEE